MGEPLRHLRTIFQLIVLLRGGPGRLQKSLENWADRRNLPSPAGIVQRLVRQDEVRNHRPQPLIVVDDSPNFDMPEHDSCYRTLSTTRHRSRIVLDTTGTGGLLGWEVGLVCLSGDCGSAIIDGGAANVHRCAADGNAARPARLPYKHAEWGISHAGVNKFRCFCGAKSDYG
jgi:hypothetical protein